jgi:DNA-binding HxlR family transcriptional regulator
MKRENVDSLNCSLANTLNLIGEWWTILIMREAIYGNRRFDDFQQQLGIARNILTDRLNKLCDSGILERIPVKEGAKRHEYKITPMGRDLYPALIALTQWGDRWLHPSDGVPIKFIERATGEEIADIAISSKDGRKLHERDLAMIPGPGATEETKERLRQMRLAWEQKMKAAKAGSDSG